MSEILKSLAKAERMAGSKDAALETYGLSKVFKDSSRPLPILKGGDLRVNKGEIVALVGPSGCGKSTFLQCAGLLDKASGGNIFIGGVPAASLGDNERTKLRLLKIGFIYQKYNLLGDFSALENIMMPMLVAGVRRVEAEFRAKKLIRAVGLGARENHRPAQLSGGEQQRVAFARALANNPDIIMADEPTGNLDPSNAGAVFDLVLDLVKKTGLAMLIVTHDSDIAARADRIVSIKDGIIG
ncbi:MAG: ABC transporter ATP-binding protein [Rickettsiales bacterium]|jgi:lipoprotein-releasing system ATP-binding protein|nr:ABC transporter ATP-binding protein [Rickettsiales bacterium]